MELIQCNKIIINKFSSNIWDKLKSNRNGKINKELLNYGQFTIPNSLAATIKRFFR